MGDEIDRNLLDNSGQRSDQFFAAECRHERADQRDAELHRGQITVGVFRQFHRQFGAAAAFFGQLFQAAFARGDDGDFGGHEKAVRQNQQKDDDQRQEHLRNLLHLLSTIGIASGYRHVIAVNDFVVRPVAEGGGDLFGFESFDSQHVVGGVVR